MRAPLVKRRRPRGYVVVSPTLSPNMNMNMNMNIPVHEALGAKRRRLDRFDPRRRGRGLVRAERLIHQPVSKDRVEHEAEGRGGLGRDQRPELDHLLRLGLLPERRRHPRRRTSIRRARGVMVVVVVVVVVVVLC